MSTNDMIIVERPNPLTIEQQRFFKNLLISQLATNMNVPAGVVLKIMRQLHFEFCTGLKDREHCSFQVLNAYDLYCEFMYLLWVSDK